MCSVFRCFRAGLEPLRNLLDVIHQRRSADLFGSLVDALTAKVRLMVILGLIVRETEWRGWVYSKNIKVRNAYSNFIIQWAIQARGTILR